MVIVKLPAYGAGLPGNVDMITGSAFLPAYLPTAGRQGGVSSRFVRERLNLLIRSNEENLFFLTLCFKLGLRFEIGILNKNKIPLDSKIGKKDQRLHNGFGSEHGQQGELSQDFDQEIRN